MKIDREYLITNYREKTTDELLDIHSSGGLTDLAYEVLEAELSARGMPVPQRREVAATPESAGGPAKFLKEHWQGKRRLASAYWLVGGVGTLVVFALALAVGMVVPDFLPVTKEVGFIFFIGIVAVLTVPIWFSHGCRYGDVPGIRIGEAGAL